MQTEANMTRSRLSRRLEKQTRKNFILSILGIFIVLFILIKFGLPMLVNFSFFISGTKATEEPKKDTRVFIAPPLINNLPDATNSAELIISGTSSPNHTINLYIDDVKINETKALGDGSFSFKEVLSLGENTIKVKSKIDGKSSGFSQSAIVIFNNTPPTLTINNPSDGQSFSKDQNFIDIKGSSSPETKITVNSFWAIVDEDSNFSYRMGLQNGENKIKVIATDRAGNKTEKEITVTYSP